MARISFNIAAKCDKAGRSQNQDNYWLCPDLSKINDSYDKTIGKDKDVVLSDKGALLVVADGMGGMNAGEKASELVIKGVQHGFSNIPDSILGNDEQMKSFIRDVIVESDKSVKEYAKLHREAEGLGSTIVLLWLWGEKAYCGWCGDSRIYRYNPNNELVRLSHDHSYVQDLVDNRKIEPEEAFDHPDGNIVTRALGDNGEKANPELAVYDIFERDVFLLCSDGLCGLLQDKQIEEIVSLNCSSTKDALAALWQAGEAAGWSDNATIELLCVVEGGKHPRGVAVGYPDKRKPVENKGDKTTKQESQEHTNKGMKRFLKPPYLYVIAAIAILVLGFVIFRSCSSHQTSEQQGVPNKQNEYVVTTTTNNLPESYTIIVSANPSGGGQVSGNGKYEQGQSCTIEASANSEYAFVKWTKDGKQVSTNSNYTFTVTESATYQAHFQRQKGQTSTQTSAQPQTQTFTVRVSAEPANAGSVTGLGSGTYRSGEKCSVCALPKSGYVFVEWTRDGRRISNGVEYTFTVDSDCNLVAYFQQQTGGDIQKVSENYEKMYKAVKHDYDSTIVIIWPRIKQDGYMTNAELNKLNDFIKNVQDLISRPDYNMLDGKQKWIMDNQLIPISDDIKRNKQKYRVFNETRPSFENSPFRRPRTYRL